MVKKPFRSLLVKVEKYDNLGNTVQQTVDNPQTLYSYNITNNEPVSSTGGISATYSYDPNGNLVAQSNQGTNWAYSWNPTGTLSGVSASGTTKGTYAYDSNGRRLNLSSPILPSTRISEQTPPQN